MKTPEAYPVAFHAALRAGGAVIEACNMPWTAKSARVRFYKFLAALRETPDHPLHRLAQLEWSVVASPLVLVIRRRERATPSTDPAVNVLKKVLDEVPPPR